MIRKPRLAVAIVLAVLISIVAGVGGGGTPASGTPPNRSQQNQEASGGSTADLHVVMVFDGLRPESINPTDTPNLYELQQSGVVSEHGNAVVPTVTRVNSASLSTGTYPAEHGLMGNAMFVPEVDPDGPFSTDDANNLIALSEATGSVLLTDTAAKRLQDQDKRVVSIGSGSSGASYLLNSGAAEDAGVMINTGDPSMDTPLAIPASVEGEILERFGPPPSKTDVPNHNASVDYATEVFIDYVLPELKPDVAYLWFTEPDNAQHASGVGSPESVETIRNDDRNLGLILERLQQTDLDANIYLTSDHGFSQLTFGVNVADELIGAGLKDGPGSTDVVLADFASTLIYVEGRDHRRIRDIVAFLQEQEYSGAIFTAARRPAGGKYRSVRPRAGLNDIVDGWVDGTFSLEMIHNANPERGPDILLTFPWTSQPNDYGVPGGITTGSTGPTGPINGGGGGPPHSGHGSISPWDIRIPLIVVGPDFKDGVTSPVPVANIDITTTILALEDVDAAELAELNGRVLVEALDDGPDPHQVPFDTRTFVRNGPHYSSAVQVSIVDDARYVDKGWRVP